MLAPLRDYLCPKDPKSSPLLCTAKKCYFSLLSVEVDPEEPGFEEAKWIISEDVNVEHLLNVFTSIDIGSKDVWDACASFMEHLYWHKPQLVMLRPKFEGLPDNHPSKPECLYGLSRLFRSVGNYVEEKQLLGHTLELWRGQRNRFQVAEALECLGAVNWQLDLYTEGIQQVEESLGIFKQLNHTIGQADSLQQLARLLTQDNQLDAAEKAASQSINLLQDKANNLGSVKVIISLVIYVSSKGETEKAINHYKAALGIASSSNWDNEQFWILYSLAQLFHKEGKFHDAQAHIEHAKSHTVNNPYLLGRAMEQQAWFWYGEGRLEEAKSEVLCAVGVYEKLGAAKDVEDCRELLQKIEGATKLVTSDRLDSTGKLLEVVLFLHLSIPHA
jgi:tetratricopeptide (TPR) repeat protein